MIAIHAFVFEADSDSPCVKYREEKNDTIPDRISEIARSELYNI